MKKTIQLLFLMMLISGILFTACAKNEGAVDEASIDEAILDADTPPSIEINLGGDAEDSVETEVEALTNTLDANYEDGSYTEVGSYINPADGDSITVTVTLKGDTISALNVKSNTTHETSKIYQGLFIEGINQLVVGKKIDEIETFSQVNGSSLTPKGFAEAINAIKADATA